MQTDPLKLDGATAKKRRFPSIAALLAALLIMAAVLVQLYEIGKSQEIQTFCGHIRDGTTAEFTNSWKEHGDTLNEISPVGNLAVIYRGFDLNNSDNANYVAQSHFLGEYKIFPRRVFTAYENTVINKGRDVINPDFQPSVEWLQQNGVRKVATFTLLGPSQLQISSAIVPPASSNEGGQ